MDAPQFHSAQYIVLQTLRHGKSARFSELMRPTGLASDVFKFHVRKLLHLGLLAKDASGNYQLTAKGKELANNLDGKTRALQKQPKLSLFLVVSRQAASGQTEYLFQQRNRNPFYGYWGFLSGPAKWGELFEETAKHELHKQTALTATFAAQGFYRQRDFSAQKDVLEDKLFVILRATNVTGELDASWHGGNSAWMTVSELQAQPKYFAASLDILARLQAGSFYTAKDTTYSATDY